MCSPTFWKFWLWYRLLTGNCPCIGFSIVSALASFAIPVTWVFSFIPVCRAAQLAGANGYWSQLGVIVAYSAICLATWVCIFSTCCGTCLLALCVPENGCSEHSMSRADWIESQRLGVVVADQPPTYAPEYAPREVERAQTDKELPPFSWPKTRDEILSCISFFYFVAASIAFPLAFIGVIPVIILHTTSYGAAFGYGCAAVGIYIGGVVLLYAAPWIAYGSGVALLYAVPWIAYNGGLVVYWTASGLNNYFCGSYRAAFAPNGFGAVPDL